LVFWFLGGTSNFNRQKNAKTKFDPRTGFVPEMPELLSLVELILVSDNDPRTGSAIQQLVDAIRPGTHVVTPSNSQTWVGLALS
jgi:hypothetical protein